MLIKVLVFLLIWTIISVLYFLHQMSDKCREGKWYEWPLMLPALGVACIIGMLYSKNSKGTRVKNAKNIG